MWVLEALKVTGNEVMHGPVGILQVVYGVPPDLCGVSQGFSELWALRVERGSGGGVYSADRRGDVVFMEQTLHPLIDIDTGSWQPLARTAAILDPWQSSAPVLKQEVLRSGYGAAVGPATDRCMLQNFIYPPCGG